MRFRLPMAIVIIAAPALVALGSGCGADPASQSQPRGTASSTGDGSALRKVELFLNWFPEAEHGGFYEALTKGYYREAGLDVAIVKGGPGKPVSPQIDQKRYLFGIENADKVLLQRDQKAEVVAVLAPLRKNPRCLMVHEKSGIKTFADLKNITLAMRAEDPFAKFLRKRVPLENVEIASFTGGIKGFLARDDYGQQGYAFSEPIQARREGADPKVLLIADLGFNPYGSVLLTHADTIRSDPELVQAMTSASIRGWVSYLNDPKAANERIAQENPEMDREWLDLSAAALRPFCESEAEELGFGTMTLKRWTELRDQLADLGMIKAENVDPAAAFAPQFAKAGAQGQRPSP